MKIWPCIGVSYWILRFEWIDLTSLHPKLLFLSCALWISITLQNTQQDCKIQHLRLVYHINGHHQIRLEVVFVHHSVGFSLRHSIYCGNFLINLGLNLEQWVCWNSSICWRLFNLEFPLCEMKLKTIDIL